MDGPVRAEEEPESEEDDEYGTQFCDSDFDLADGDDDLFDSHVDEGKGKEPQIEVDGVSEDDDIYLPDSDEESVRMNFKAFSDKDLHCPKFEVGQTFQYVGLLRKAIREYNCQSRVDIKMPINDQKRLSARCEKDCPWYLWASFDKRANCLMIKKHCPEHTCSKKFKDRKSVV